MSVPAAVPRARAVRRPLALVAVLVSLAALAAAGCTSSGGGPGQEAASADEAGGGGRTRSAPTTIAQEPDVLADPGVAAGECRMVTYTPPTSASAQQGELCRPRADQRDVVVVIVHGGAGIAGTFAGLRPWQTRLNAEGYVTLNIDYHLFQPGGQSPVFPQPEQNVKAAVQFLRGTGSALGIRKDRIAVQGHSAGARLGAVAFTSPGDPWFAGPELWPGIADTVNAFVGFYHPYDGSMQHQAQYYGGPDDSQLPAVQERWARADSLANAGRAAGPALLLTGDEDWDIQIAQQEVFKAGLEGAGRLARTVVVEGGGHGFDEGDGTRLSRLGEQAAGDVLRFLNDVFGQDPARPAMVAEPDLDGAPEGTGVPQTTFVPRPRQYTTPTTTRRGTASANGSGAANGTAGRTPTTTAKPVTPPTTAAPRPTTAPTTRPPVTSPPTTAKPSTPTSSPAGAGSGTGTGAGAATG